MVTAVVSPIVFLCFIISPAVVGASPGFPPPGLSAPLLSTCSPVLESILWDPCTKSCKLKAWMFILPVVSLSLEATHPVTTDVLLTVLPTRCTMNSD